jgi:peptidoglycan/xylan/chitin deacetylase (PgdA/CDA1 family)
MKPGVFITVDVECSMGGAWYDPALKPVPPSRAMTGRFGRRELGCPLIVDILRESGLGATFFVDPFVAEQGWPGEAAPVVERLVRDGQDVQLHAHPVHVQYGLRQAGRSHRLTDDFAALSPGERAELLADGAARLEKWTGKKPIAFRAGNLNAGEESLAELPAAGLRIDSSYCFAFAGGQCRFSAERPFNGSRWHGEVLELALSAFRLPHCPWDAPAKPVDLMGVSFAECREAIERILAAGADAVAILHSFSLMKVRDKQYTAARRNWIVERRLRQLCQWLARRKPDAPTYTFAQLGEAMAAGEYQAREAAPCTASSRARALARKGAQLYNRCYWT